MDTKDHSSIFTVKQIPVGGLDHNFSYLIVENRSSSAIVVDPCGDVGLIEKALRELEKIQPAYILLTHGHHDHCSGIKELQRFFNAPVAAHPNCSYQPDISLLDGDKLTLGGGFMECLHTPGHSTDSVIYRLSDDSAIFTGDTLFIDWIGYCVAKTMFRSLREVIFPMKDSNFVYSGHDYGSEKFRQLGDEKIKNPYLKAISFSEFKKELKNL